MAELTYQFLGLDVELSLLAAASILYVLHESTSVISADVVFSEGLKQSCFDATTLMMRLCLSMVSHRWEATQRSVQLIS